MNIEKYILKGLKKSIPESLKQSIKKPDCEQDPNKSGQLIYNILAGNNPCMISRFGSTELSCLSNYLSVQSGTKDYLGYIKGKVKPWWWESSIILQMKNWSGFFPPTIEKVEQFCKLMLNDIPEVDILGSWLADETLFEDKLKNAAKVRLYTLEPFWSKVPWTRALENKKVLVVHPFKNSILHQYQKRSLIFNNNLLPQFELKTLQAIQSLGGDTEQFSDWFQALDYMKSEIEKIDFDICLLGCGAYGFPLAAHIKRLGRKAFHLGGSLQLLFGIKGKRWENPVYGKAVNLSYPSLFNEHWIRPLEEEKPKNSDKVENSCYW